MAKIQKSPTLSPLALEVNRKKPEEKSNLLNLDLSFGRGNLTQKAIFAKNLAVMLRAGLTLSEALVIIADSSTGSLRKVTKGLLLSVQSGNTLADSFARYPRFFSGIFVNATYAGESSGTLEKNLEAIALQLQKEKELVSKIKQALLYPIVVLVAAFIMGVAMSLFVLPKIIPMFEGLKVDLPVTTRMLISFSHFIRDYGFIFFGSVIVFILFLIWLGRQRFTHPFTHWLLLRLPVFSKITRNNNLARFCRNLNTLLNSGINIDRALDITKDTLSNYYYKQAIGSISIRISKGVSLSQDLQQYSHLFSPMLIKMIVVGEKSGQLEETLAYLAGFYEEEVDNATKSLAVAIEPILLILIGLVVAFLALSIITPIYNITGGINR